MPFTISQFLDHGTQNPIVARLAVQTLEIIGQCNIADATRDGVVDIYINSLMKKLLRCWEIAERYRLDFNKQVESYKPPVAGTQMVSVPSVVGLEQECHNFLYEAKSFIRDALKAFNLLYGTGFVEGSEYARPKKKVGKSLIEFAEATFGPNDPKTAFLKKLSPTVEQVVRFRNAVEHPGGHSGVLNIRNFRLEPDAKLSEPCWWTEKDGQKTRESSIGADFGGIINKLLALTELIFVSWAAENLRMPNFLRIVCVPRENRDANNPVKYVVDASEEAMQLIAKAAAKKDAQGGAQVSFSISS